MITHYHDDATTLAQVASLRIIHVQARAANRRVDAVILYKGSTR